jgi:hypothetical protein
MANFRTSNTAPNQRAELARLDAFAQVAEARGVRLAQRRGLREPFAGLFLFAQR